MSVHAYVLCVCVHVTMHVCVRVHTCACMSRRRVQKAPIWFSVDEQEGPCRRVGRGSGPRPRRRREARWKAKERNASPADGIRGGPSECSAPGARPELRASRGSVADEQVRLRGDPCISHGCREHGAGSGRGRPAAGRSAGRAQVVVQCAVTRGLLPFEGAGYPHPVARGRGRATGISLWRATPWRGRPGLSGAGNGTNEPGAFPAARLPSPRSRGALTRTGGLLRPGPRGEEPRGRVTGGAGDGHPHALRARRKCSPSGGPWDLGAACRQSHTDRDRHRSGGEGSTSPGRCPTTYCRGAKPGLGSRSQGADGRGPSTCTGRCARTRVTHKGSLRVVRPSFP